MSQKMHTEQLTQGNQTSSSPFKSYQTSIKKELKSSLFEMVEVPENNRNDSENKLKSKVKFFLSYEG